MKVKDYMSTPVVTVPPVTSAQDAARCMDLSGVGCLVVVEEDRILGLVTDRDLALRVLARGLPADTRIGQVMSSPVLGVTADDDIDAAAAMFRRHTVRRLPVLAAGAVVGVIAIDDLLLHAHQLLSATLAPVSGEILEPQHPGTRGDLPGARG